MFAIPNVHDGVLEYIPDGIKYALRQKLYIAIRIDVQCMIQHIASAPGKTDVLILQTVVKIFRCKIRPEVDF